MAEKSEDKRTVLEKALDAVRKGATLSVSSHLFESSVGCALGDALPYLEACVKRDESAGIEFGVERAAYASMKEELEAHVAKLNDDLEVWPDLVYSAAGMQQENGEDTFDALRRLRIRVVKAEAEAKEWLEAYSLEAQKKGGDYDLLGRIDKLEANLDMLLDAAGSTNLRGKERSPADGVQRIMALRERAVKAGSLERQGRLLPIWRDSVVARATKAGMKAEEGLCDWFEALRASLTKAEQEAVDWEENDAALRVRLNAAEARVETAEALAQRRERERDEAYAALAKAGMFHAAGDYEQARMLLCDMDAHGHAAVALREFTGKLEKAEARAKKAEGDAKAAVAEAEHETRLYNAERAENDTLRTEVSRLQETMKETRRIVDLVVNACSDWDGMDRDPVVGFSLAKQAHRLLDDALGTRVAAETQTAPKYEFDEGARQAIILALAKLSLARPGWSEMLRGIAATFHGGPMWDEFVSHGPDAAAEAEDPDTSRTLNLKWGEHEGHKGKATEWHAPCGCAFHPEPFPHVHPCSEAHDRSKRAGAEAECPCLTSTVCKEGRCPCECHRPEAEKPIVVQMLRHYEAIDALKARPDFLASRPSPATDAIPGQHPQDTGPMTGIWRCEDCGELLDISTGEWHWDGIRWAHSHGQAGHIAARYFGPMTDVETGEGK